MFKKFYERYSPEEQEAIVLIRSCLGASPLGDDFLDMISISLGMVFPATGEVHIREGRLRWPVSKNDQQNMGWGRFSKGQICRVRIRKLLDEYVPKHTTPEKFNSWCVTEVLEQSVSCPQLESVWEEYNKPVVIEDEILGTLTLNREFDMFETCLFWNGEEVSLMLEVDSEDKSSWDCVRDTAKKMVTGQKSWDKSMKEFAAGKLAGLSNDWQADEDENGDAQPITEESFAKRISLSELSISSEGGFTAYYDDDDLFWGHAVEVCGSLEEGPTSANIAG